jgi:hypothetical protein
MKEATPVIVESPYAGDIERNLRYVRACMRDCLLKGEAPFASHALYTQHGVLRDEDPAERQHGIEAGFAFRQLTKKTVVYTDLGLSAGMKYGIKHAEQIGHPIEYRTLRDEWGLMTIREFVVHALSWPPYDGGATATQLWHFAKATHRNIKLESLSGQLCKMVKANELEKLDGFGPRGGNGYMLPATLWRCRCGSILADSYDSCCGRCGSSEMINIGRERA